MAGRHYGELRDQLLRESFPWSSAPVVLRDAGTDYVPIPICERLAQCIWYDQRLQVDDLRTSDDQRLRVVFPGWWNVEAGPDFRHATIQIGDEPERTGDIEVHLRGEDWFHHGHHRDARFNNVILHVVLWEAGGPVPAATRAGERLPLLVLQRQLASPLETLHDEIDLDAYPHHAEGHGGGCAAALRELDTGEIGDLLDAAGDERFDAKTRRFRRWIHRAGPAQAFFEGWMEALGYKANKTGFRLLAQRLPLAELLARRSAMAPLLFGLANFLTESGFATRAASGHRYEKRLWSLWWKLRPAYVERILPARVWRFHGLRPANHPHRRLGAAVALLRRHPDLLGKVTGAVESGGDPRRLITGLHDEYWDSHFRLGGRVQRRAGRLLGESRADEIIANVILPFLAADADLRGDGSLAENVRVRSESLRPTPSNSLLRLASAQLFGSVGAARPILHSCRRQQGLLQVFHDFCLPDKSACQLCRFPALVQSWTVTGTE